MIWSFMPTSASLSQISNKLTASYIHTPEALMICAASLECVTHIGNVEVCTRVISASVCHQAGGRREGDGETQSSSR